MGKFVLSFLLLILSIGLYCQKLTIDTVKAYEIIDFVNTTQGGVTTCRINGRDYPPEVCEKFGFENNPLLSYDEKNPKLHFVETYSMDDTLLYSTYMIDIEVTNFGPYREYYPNGKLKVKGQFLFFGLDPKPYEIYENHNCKTGKWFYYRNSGELWKTEIYRKNKLIKVR